LLGRAGDVVQYGGGEICEKCVVSGDRAITRGRKGDLQNCGQA
jgi:hypothetical protein